MNEPIKLPSGAKLVIGVIPFDDADELLEAVAAEGMNIRFSGKEDIHLALKDVMCVAISSKRVKAAVRQCMQRCTYNGMKIDKDTFEPAEARKDYVSVMIEVGKAALSPFTSDLYATLSVLFQKIELTSQA